MMKQNKKLIEEKDSKKVVSRREFLGAATAGVGAAALGLPFIAAAQETISWRFQSTWPANTIFHEFAKDWANKVAVLSGGKLKIEVLPAGAVVPGLQVIDATSRGVLDGAHAIPGFWFGKNTAFGLYGAGPDFAMNPNQMLAWVERGGGKELYAELMEASGLNVVSFLNGPIPCEPLGWFKKEVHSVEDLKGMRYRTAGLAVDLFMEMGMSPVQMAPNDIVPALDRGVLDAAEFANPTDDRLMGFSDVAKFYVQQSYHQANSVLEMMINKKRYEALPEELKQILEIANKAASSDMSWKAMDRMSSDLIALQTEHGVKVYRTPEDILKAQLTAWEQVIDKHASNPLFRKVVDSQRSWAQRVSYYQEISTASQTLAYDHYFPNGPQG